MRSAIFIAVLCLCTISFGAEPRPLWETTPPGAKGNSVKDIPTITPYLSENPNGCGILICPGGGYGGLAVDHEGKQIAAWCNSFGVNAFVLRYRLNPYRHPIPLTDVTRAMRLIRHDHQKYGIDPQRIGVIGFSAGGHLASSLATHFDAGDETAADSVETTSSRPDFAILCYPVITMELAFTHRGSRRNLLGDTPDEALVTLMSNEQQVTKQTPPTFIWHTQNDSVVPVENAIAFYSALVRSKVPSELHIYPRGRHGLGLAKNIDGVNQWPAACQSWITRNGWLKPGPQEKSGESK